MNDESAWLCGDVDWPKPKERMDEILRATGLNVYVGKYSVRIDDCSHFVFQEYGGDLGDPTIDADADSAEEMINDAKKVSEALANANVNHSFEIYDQDENLVETIKYPA